MATTDSAGRGKRALPLRLFGHGGLVVNSVLLTVLLVVSTALLVAGAIIVAVGRQIEDSADRRLTDGATFFKASLDSSQEDLAAIGTWLTRDRELIATVRQDRRQDIQERLALALRLQAVDEVLVANTQGDIAARLRTDQVPAANGQISQNQGFLQALSGRASYGIEWDNDDFLQQVMYFPIISPIGERPIGVVRLASFLDGKDLDRFRLRTGLDASLFFGGARVVTTLGQPNGMPITEIGPDPYIYQQVVGSGRELHASRNLPIGQVRSFYVPLIGSDGTRVGMLSIAVPINTVIGQWQDALVPTLPVTLVIVLGGAALAYVLARGVREPVLTLVNSAAGLARGDLSTPIPAVREVELAPLAEQLELARRSLRVSLEAAANEEARQRAIFAALREPVLITSASGAIIDFNGASCSLFGNLAQFRGRSIQELLPFVVIPSQSETENETWQGRVVDTTGYAIDIEVSRTILVEGHLPVSVVYVIHDISRYTEMNRLREQLLYSVSHELRAPLAVLDNVLEILANDFGELTADELDHLMGAARRTTQRLRGLMDNLLSAGSIQSGRFAVQAEPTELQPIIEEAIEMVEAALKTRNQDAEHFGDLNHLYVLADKRYAIQVLTNLLYNASKYSPDDEVIKVHVAKKDGHARITVEDRGPGIPREQQAGLFDRFYRIHQGNEEPGIGLGLAIVKGIVEAHGGAVGIDSEVGAGTRIWFTLPTTERLK